LGPPIFSGLVRDHERLEPLTDGLPHSRCYTVVKIEDAKTRVAKGGINIYLCVTDASRGGRDRVRNQSPLFRFDAAENISYCFNPVRHLLQPPSSLIVTTRLATNQRRSPMQAGLLEQASKSLSGFRLPNPIRKFFRFSPMDRAYSGASSKKWCPNLILSTSVRAACLASRSRSASRRVEKEATNSPGARCPL